MDFELQKNKNLRNLQDQLKKLQPELRTKVADESQNSRTSTSISDQNQVTQGDLAAGTDKDLKLGLTERDVRQEILEGKLASVLQPTLVKSRREDDRPINDLKDQPVYNHKSNKARVRTKLTKAVMNH